MKGKVENILVCLNPLLRVNQLLHGEIQLNSYARNNVLIPYYRSINYYDIDVDVNMQDGFVSVLIPYYRSINYYKIEVKRYDNSNIDVLIPYYRSINYYR